MGFLFRMEKKTVFRCLNIQVDFKWKIMVLDVQIFKHIKVIYVLLNHITYSVYRGQRSQP